MQKFRNRPHTTIGNYRSKRSCHKKKRIFKPRRERISLSVLALLILVGVGGLTLFIMPLPGGNEGSLPRVTAPAVADAPEPVAEIMAQTEEPAAKKQATEQATADRQAAQEQKTDEQEATPPPPEDPTLYLTVPRLGINGHTVRNDDSQWALDAGASKIPSTGFPWQGGANTYIAGHRIGWPNTESYYQFYNLPTMQAGDPVYLTDTNGTVYTYEVSDIFAVSPSDVGVTNPVAGRDMITLQTCTETPNDWWTIGPGLFELGPDSGRLIVQADKVAVDSA